MNFLKRGLSLSLISILISSLLFVSCNKNKEDILETLTPIKPEYIKFNKKSISPLTVQEKEKLEYPIAFSLDKYELNISFKPLGDVIEGFFGKGLGGIKFEGNRISFLNNMGEVQSSHEYDFKDGVDIKIYKDIDSIKYFIDQKLIVSFDIKTNMNAVLLRGAPIFYMSKGTAEVIYYYINSYKKPVILLIGDSIIEGAAFVLFKSPITNKWSNLVDGVLGEDKVAIDGLGGGKMSAETADRIIKEIELFKPKLVFVCFGTNNTSSAAEYIDNVSKVIDYCGNKGTKLVLSTSLPRPNYDFSRSGGAINDWIRNSKLEILDYYGYLYENGSIVSNRFFNDTFHPNISGNRIIADRAIEIIKKKDF